MLIVANENEFSVVHPPRLLWRLFGMPFLLGGAFLEYKAITAWRPHPGSHPIIDHAIIMVLPALAIFAGIAFCFAFRGVKINRHATSVTEWWGIFRTLRIDEKHIKTPKSVHLTQESDKVTSGRYSHTTWTSVSYCVRLGGRYGYVFEACGVEADARKVANALAHFLECELIDDLVQQKV
jgi:hypothetical protein